MAEPERAGRLRASASLSADAVITTEENTVEVSASQRGILEAWLTLIEGLVEAVPTCPRGFQPPENDWIDASQAG